METSRIWRKFYFLAKEIKIHLGHPSTLDLGSRHGEDAAVHNPGGVGGRDGHSGAVTPHRTSSLE